MERRRSRLIRAVVSESRSALSRRIGLLAVTLLTLVFSASAQERPLKIDYRLAMSQPSSHLFEVAIEVQLPADRTPESLDFQMAKWSPGRYAVFDFAKNVQEAEAIAGVEPRPARMLKLSVPMAKVDDQTWRVQTLGNHSVTFK